MKRDRRVWNDYMRVCVVVETPAFVRSPCTCTGVGVSVCVSKIIKRPQERVIPPLCASGPPGTRAAAEVLI